MFLGVILGSCGHVDLFQSFMIEVRSTSAKFFVPICFIRSLGTASWIP